MKYIPILLAIAMTCAFGFVTFKAINQGATRFEQSECVQWKNQELEYEKFFVADWQREQCKQFNVLFDE
ncbi:MAG: hypothetical protein BWY14_01025 [Parcubacteria group bacterium ADurb.Bin192]|nr:MAG: hypothetical protein BWY14_01025 [Parcubacteria group bacterium ADurb.Bin192]